MAITTEKFTTPRQICEPIPGHFDPATRAGTQSRGEMPNVRGDQPCGVGDTLQNHRGPRRAIRNATPARLRRRGRDEASRRHQGPEALRHAPDRGD